MIIYKWLIALGRYILLMGRTFSRPERFRMFWKRYVTEMSSLGVDSIGIVLLISFFIGAVICIQMKLNIQSPWMPRWVSGYTLEIMGVNSAGYLILPKILGLITIMPFLVIFSATTGILGAYATAFIGHVLTPEDLTAGLQHSFSPWFLWMSIIKSVFFAFIITSVSSFFGYSVEGGSVEVGKASTAAVVNSSVLILFSDVFLTQLLS